MDRARRAAVTALVTGLLLVSALVFGGGLGARSLPSGMVAAVSWPTSTLVVAEVVTGGASASDEFIEVSNAGPTQVDLQGMEIVYATSSGVTVTRKASWSASRPLGSGQHLFVANSLGTYGATADATYSGGLAATGGAVALRVIGGSVVDAVGWGDAANSFVEGTAASAPAAGSSIERRPGGALGNGTDTNNNAADWFVQSSPSPQNLAAPATPPASPSPSTSTAPSPTPTGTPSPTPTETATLEPTATPTVEPTPTPTVEPTPSATPTLAPTFTPTVEPTAAPTPTPTPTPVPISIADARTLPDGATARISGTLTTPLGVLDAGHGGFVQDASAGLALYLDATAETALPAGTVVVVTGSLDTRYSQRTLRVDAADVVAIGSAALPVPVGVATGGAGEVLEGTRIGISGTTVGSPSALADGTAFTVDDGSGPLRVIVAAAALGDLAVPSGTMVVAAGPLGQRDSSGTGLEGYRVFATEPGEFVVVEATPTPSSSVGPVPSPTPEPEPTPTPTASISPSTPPVTPTPTLAPPPTPTPPASPPVSTPIAIARTQPIGTRVAVIGTVTAEASRLGTPPLIAIGDVSGGIVVRIPDGTAPPARNARLLVTGQLADPYGQLEIRPQVGGIQVVGTAGPIAPRTIAGHDLGESMEGVLVRLDGAMTSTVRKATSGDLAFDLRAADGTLQRIMADASSGLGPSSFTKGSSYRLTGIVGQRASHKSALDGYRLWLRDRADVVLLGSPQPGSSGSPGSTPSASSVSTISIGRALLVRDGAVRVVAVVTVGASLLDASGRRIVIQDASAAVEVYLPSNATAPRAGRRVSVEGTVVRAYGAPRLKATRIRDLGSAPLPRPLELRAAPTAAYEWRLVRTTGVIEDVHKLGDRWRAEAVVGSTHIPIAGLSGSGIESTALVEGRVATIVGIVRRPYPTAMDRRFAIMPRSRADLTLGVSVGSRSSEAGNPSMAGPTASAYTTGAIDADIAGLDAHVGAIVRIGGLVVDLLADGITIDDGTATGRVILAESAVDYLPLLEPGDAVNAVGRVERRDGGLVVVVADAAGISRVGDPAAEVSASVPPVETSPDADPRERTLATFTEPPGIGAAETAGLASIGLITLASIGVTLLRRRRMRRELLARVSTRLAALSATSASTAATGSIALPGSTASAGSTLVPDPAPITVPR